MLKVKSILYCTILSCISIPEIYTDLYRCPQLFVSAKDSSRYDLDVYLPYASGQQEKCGYYCYIDENGIFAANILAARRGTSLQSYFNEGSRFYPSIIFNNGEQWSFYNDPKLGGHKQCGPVDAAWIAKNDPKAQQEGRIKQPLGSYSQTCHSCAYDGSTLTCQCKKRDGKDQPTAKSGCDSYKNDNGLLECE